MKNRTESPNQRLRRLLRAHDPAADGAEPSAEEVARWRSRLLRESGGGASRPPSLAWLLPAAALLAAGIVIGVFARGALTPRSRGAIPAAGGAPPAELRTIRMSAPGGTRIIWTMNPRLDLSRPRQEPL
jgi:hypothetical protein